MTRITEIRWRAGKTSDGAEIFTAAAGGLQGRVLIANDEGMVVISAAIRREDGNFTQLIESRFPPNEPKRVTAHARYERVRLAKILRRALRKQQLAAVEADCEAARKAGAAKAAQMDAAFAAHQAEAIEE